MSQKWHSILIILLVSLLLFIKPLLSNQPLGLDSLGHLSKVSYLRLYPFADWDMSWYSGTLFLKLYSPLFYYILALFTNVFFGANFLCFLSVFLSSIGIYIFVKYKTKNENVSLFCGLGYLSILSISYYWISAGNYPYYFAIWTLPFSLYFLEKTLETNNKKDFILYCLFFAAGILIHVLIGFLIGALMILRLLFEGINPKNIKKMLIFGIIPILLTSFWFLPFISYSIPSNGFDGYIPKSLQLFGLNDRIAWGLQVGGLGVMSFLFIFLLLFFNRYYKDKMTLFYLLSTLFLGFLVFGGLGNHYPLGVDPVRFILPLSVMLLLFIGSSMNQSGLLSKKYLIIALILLLLFGIIWNYLIISKNFITYSYVNNESRYAIISNIIKDPSFPLKNEFNNYRFGTSKFIFGENLNYFMPNVAQTFGYQDAGMLNAPRYYDMRWHIWLSNDTDKAIYWLDTFGIKYFEAENKDFIDKYKKDMRFKIIMEGSKDYNFTLFEYKDPKHIISLVDYINETSFGKEKPFSWKRDNPDKVIVEYNSIDKNDAVLFKEFYHKTWKAKELKSGKSLDIHKTEIGFMYVKPNIESKGVIFYQSKTFEDYLGISLTLLGILILLFYSKLNFINTHFLKLK